DAFNYLGVLLGQLKRYRESVQVFEKGIYLYKNSYQLYFNQGIVLEMARRLEDASVSFEKAYELDRKDPVLIYYYTATLLKLREYSKAIRIYKTGISNFPKDAELIYGLSKVYVNMGETDIAVDLLKKALELDSSYIIKLKKDIDFKILYNHSEYQSLLSS
ncbi:MAG: tetratricopeptide repeat protein, partial [Ruminiclostridium sp.]|nr:tetratricopeptide repeat protein [Ruminiclostridium sp.]